MKGEQREKRIPNFIGNAVIILTAAHLGCEVEMLTIAQEVWRTKRLPEAVLLGMYEKAARKAVSAVRKLSLIHICSSTSAGGKRPLRKEC